MGHSTRFGLIIPRPFELSFKSYTTQPNFSALYFSTFFLDYNTIAEIIISSFPPSLSSF